MATDSDSAGDAMPPDCEVIEVRGAELRQLFNAGPCIGLAFLGAASGLAGTLTGALDSAVAGIVRESLIIAGWVAMWRPLEIFLYDWWPISAEAKRYDRLAAMPVRIQYAAEGAPDAWMRDWPTIPAGAQGARDRRDQP